MSTAQGWGIKCRVCPAKEGLFQERRQMLGRGNSTCEVSVQGSAWGQEEGEEAAWLLRTQEEAAESSSGLVCPQKSGEEL